MAKTKPRKDLYLILTKEFLEENLKKYSANYIAKNLVFPPTHASTLIAHAKKLGVKTHSIRESSLLKTVQNQYKKTIKKRYGCTNISQIQSVKDKKVEKALEKYGCINVFQAEEVKQKSNITMMKKYGVIAMIQLPKFKRNNGKMSLMHKDISKFLKLKKIKHKNECQEFNKFSKEKDRYYSPCVDICIINKKLIIEINGDKWHANPQIYMPNDKIQTWGGLLMAKDIWKKDKAREKHLKSFGYKIIYIWEKDFRENKLKVYKDLLNEISKN